MSMLNLRPSKSTPSLLFQKSIKQELTKLMTLELDLAATGLCLHFCKAVFLLNGAITINHPDPLMKKPETSLSPFFSNIL
jgi:hypothetical protein